METMSGWEIFWIVLAVALAAGAFVLSFLTWRARHLVRAPHPAAPAPTPDAERRLVAFVANPSKPDVAALRNPVEKACRGLGLEPLWLETTVEDPGTGQARAALEAGAEVVVAAGGDGTVRAVATALQGTGTPMGLLPVGTGNLLARNLDIPVTDLARSLEIALEGRDRPIDVAWLRVTDAPDDHEDAAEVDTDHIFLVIAGIGFDAAMIADTDTTLKAKVGWIAYFLGGIRHLHGRRLEAHVALDESRRASMKLRTLLVGNCGRLPGGITLLPDALVDDGILDVAAIDTRGGVAGWAQLFGEVVMQGLGVQPLSTTKIGRIDHTQAKHVEIRVPGGAQAQVDGDTVGIATAIECRVDPGGLVVRVPRTITL